MQDSERLATLEVITSDLKKTVDGIEKSNIFMGKKIINLEESLNAYKFKMDEMAEDSKETKRILSDDILPFVRDYRSRHNFYQNLNNIVNTKWFLLSLGMLILAISYKSDIIDIIMKFIK